MDARQLQEAGALYDAIPSREACVDVWVAAGAVDVYSCMSWRELSDTMPEMAEAIAAVLLRRASWRR